MSFFIVGPFRSGTTFTSKVLSLSPFCNSLCEPFPHLNPESRHQYEGFLQNPYETLNGVIGKRISVSHDIDKIHIEKQISLVPFIKEIHTLYGGKFIIPIRRPESVIRSALNWHYSRYPVIYREAQLEHPLSDAAARINTSILEDPGYDTFDYSLPRPLPGDPYHNSWHNLSRLEMCAWYWSNIYRQILDSVDDVGKDNFFFLNYFSSNIHDQIASLCQFIGIPKVDSNLISTLVDSACNTSASANSSVYTEHDFIDSSTKEIIYNHCFDVAQDLGIVTVPKDFLMFDYGRYWKDIGSNIEPYKEMHEYRIESHRLFSNWATYALSEYTIDSVLEIGVGLNPYYRNKLFKDVTFIGVDIVPKIIEALRHGNVNPCHSFFCDDISESIDFEYQTADLVFSHASIDNVANVQGFVDGLAARTNKLLVITTYRGYFPQARYHKHTLDSNTGVCFNDISTLLLRKQLKLAGFKSVVIIPYRTFRDDIEHETLVIASKQEYSPEILLGPISPSQIYEPYVVTDSALSTRQDVFDIANNACLYYSQASSRIANSIDYFKSCLLDLKSFYAAHNTRLDQSSTPNSTTRLLIRIDIDNDLTSAHKMAQVGKEVEIEMSFYVRPTAPYYASFSEDKFYRHPGVVLVLQDIQNFGHEIGLHIDPFHYYITHNVDGGQATKCELDYLRHSGLVIRGATGHNCASYYGAESIEIFDAFNFSNRTFFLTPDDVCCPLGSLSARDLAIEYDGSYFNPPLPHNPNEPISAGVIRNLLNNPKWMKDYLGHFAYSSQAVGSQLWCIGLDKWVLYSDSVNGPHPTYLHAVAWDQIVNTLAVCEPHPMLVVLHPCYFGFRNVL